MTEPKSVRFTAALLRPAQPKNATWRFLRVPPAASKQLPSRGMVSVTGTLDGQAFKATLEPDGEGSHWLKVPRALARKVPEVALDTRFNGHHCFAGSMPRRCALSTSC